MAGRCRTWQLSGWELPGYSYSSKREAKMRTARGVPSALDHNLLSRKVIEEMLSLDRPSDASGSFFAEMVQVFSQSGPDIITQMAAAFTSRDHAAVRHLAHKLKGMAATVGARILAGHCEIIEEKAAVLEWPPATAFANLESTFLTSFGALRAVIDQVSLGEHARTSSAENSAAAKQSVALSVTEDQMLDLLSSMNDQAVFMTDSDGNVVSWNSGAERLTGFDPDAVLGKHFSMFYLPGDSAAGRPQQHLEAAKSRGRFEEDGIRVRRDGSKYWTRVIIIPQYDDLGQPLGFLNFRRDITAHKITQQESAAAQRRFAALFENSLDPIAFLEYRNQVPEFNPAFLNMVGYSLSELLENDQFKKLTPPEYGYLDATNQQLVKSTLTSARYEKEYLHRDGTRIPVLITVFPLVDGDIMGMAAVARDLRAEKRVLAELTRAKEAALDLAAAKSAFLATMSHEIRTPLNGVIGMVSLLALEGLSEDSSHYVRNIKIASEHLLTVVNEILDYTKLESGKFEIESVAFDLRKLLDETAALFVEEARTKHLKLTSSIDADVHDRIQSAPSKIRQILFNFLGNALKFTADGEINLICRCLSRGANRQELLFEVRDTGIGIKPEDISKLFLPFSQAESSTTRRFGGTGLGLIISKKIAEVIGGEVGVKSEFGVGSTFWFRAVLPLAAKTSHAAAAEAGADGGSVAARTHHLPATHIAPGKKVLVVDDNRLNLDVAVRMLARVGLTADVAINGLEAVVAAKTGIYNLILMDCLMPEMDGFSATREIRKLASAAANVPIVAMTANTRSDDWGACQAAGMDDFLEKPVRFDVFLAVLEKYLPADAA